MAKPLRKLLRRLQNWLGIHPVPRPFRLSSRPEYAAYTIGEWTYGRPRIYSWDKSTHLQIGNFCSIAEEVVILLGGEHRTDWVTTYPFSSIFPDAERFPGHPKSKGDVEIGNDVWIGFKALILSGVKIGDGAAIAARSVVSSDVPPYAIYAGNPARLVRYRFTPAQIEALLKIRWWDWPLEKVKQNWPLLLGPDIDAFIQSQL